MSTKNTTYRIKPYQYIHVLNKNNNVTKLVIGPKTYIREENEVIQSGDNAAEMVVIPPNCFCEIQNPVMMKDNAELYDKNGQVKVLLGENEFRFYEQYSKPFPLFPGEQLKSKPRSMEMANQLQAFRVKALRDFSDSKSVKRNAGDIWHIYGPGVYRPRIEQELIQIDSSQVYDQNTNLLLKAIHDFKDQNDIERKAGESYVIKNPKHYLCSVNEEIKSIERPIILDDQKSLKLTAIKNLTDVYGKARKAGEIWLVTHKMASFHTLDLNEQLLEETSAIILNYNQYCTISNPFDFTTNLNRNGIKELRKGPSVFFLQPGEEILNGLHEIEVLKEDEAVLVQANAEVETEQDNKKTKRNAGDKWMEYGPKSYIPPVEVDIVEKRFKIPLDKNEGIYVRDTKSGTIRTVVGQTYMLLAHEELWEYPLGEEMEQLLKNDLEFKNGRRVGYKVINYKIPFNSAVQIYDYKTKQSRIVFGPNMVQLQPDEQFTMTRLSGKTPKLPGIIKTIHINLGPDFSTDVVTVETSDHAALMLKLSYNWEFKVDRNDIENTKKMFTVKDFVGDLCNLMASQVRSAVAAVDFDTFHKTSARLIRKSIFGTNVEGKINDYYLLEKNNLMITNIDIQNVEPIDAQTKANLQKTVTMAIEITTKRQEAQARHLAEKLEQEAKGELANQLIDDKSKAESFNKKLLGLQAQSKAVLNQGQAVAQARASAEAKQINGESRLQIANLKAKVNKVINEQYNQTIQRRFQITFEHDTLINDLNIKKEKSLAEIDSNKFQSMVDAIGKATLVAMAQAGPEYQAQLLQGLGLTGFIMTDGNNPLNLFDSACGLVGQLNNQQ